MVVHLKTQLNQTDKKVWELIRSSISSEKTYGDAAISEKHANFFVNKKNAKSKDMKSLINFVKKRSEKKNRRKTRTRNCGCKIMLKILILAGGYSNEREISLITAKSVIKELKRDKKYKILLLNQMEVL